MLDMQMDQILSALNSACQRATYGAVAAMVGKTPRTLMKGRPRDQRHSWVVNRKNGLPTGYEPAQLHPALQEHAHVIDSRAELAGFLSSHSGIDISTAQAA